MASVSCRLSEAARILESNAPDAPAAMGVADGKLFTELPIHIRGNHRNLGEPVARGFPEVMRTPDAAPVLPDNASGRLELAQWLASGQHPLTARVYVNRVWRWHFGAGLVASTDNFGIQGDRPSHPELLDWLAGELLRNEGSLKAVHRIILTSATYRQSSRFDAAKANIDADNRLLWRMSPKRLEAESIRDAMLLASGELNSGIGGPGGLIHSR